MTENNWHLSETFITILDEGEMEGSIRALNVQQQHTTQ